MPLETPGLWNLGRSGFRTSKIGCVVCTLSRGVQLRKERLQLDLWALLWRLLLIGLLSWGHFIVQTIPSGVEASSTLLRHYTSAWQKGSGTQWWLFCPSFLGRIDRPWGSLSPLLLSLWWVESTLSPWTCDVEYSMALFPAPSPPYAMVQLHTPKTHNQLVLPLCLLNIYYSEC